MTRRPEVDPKHIAVFGISYGSQAALLLGVHYPHLVKSVVALVPSNVVRCGIVGADRSGPSTRKYCLGSAWTIGGRALPFTKLVSGSNPWDNPRATIPVERIRGRVLLNCGGRDQRADSCAAAHAIVRRRKKYGEVTQLHVYPQAGHYVGSPFLVYEPGSLRSDLFDPADERGREDFWPKLIAFLRE
jgi:pimeloyl-ACP methyl ester carboxylesterase